MKSVEFIEKIQDYYGNYPDGQKIEIATYLRHKRETFLTELYKQLIANYSAKWKTPPDVAIFNEQINEVLKTEERQAGQLQIGEDRASLEEGKQFFNDLWEKIGAKWSNKGLMCNSECGQRISFQAGGCRNKDCKYLREQEEFDDILF